jgi:hypothetical protein
MAQLINEVKRMQLLAGLITESQFISEGIKLDVLMKDGKPNSEMLVVPNRFYGDEEELRGATLRAKELKKEEGRKDMMIFSNVGGGLRGDQQYPIEGDEIADIILYDDAKKKLRESQLNEEAINFGDKDQFSDFLQNKTKELEGKTIKLSVFDTFAMGDPEKEKFTGDISVNLGKRTGGTGNLTYDATLVDAGGYKYLSPSKGKKISLTIPSTTGGQGSFENEELKLKGLFKVKSLEMPGTQAESINIDSVVNEALRKLRKGK